MNSGVLENKGSTARDFFMLERNILSHFKLAILLSILSSSLILQARLIPSTGEEEQKVSGIPLGTVEFVTALAAIAGGVWEYYNGYRDLRESRAFLAAVKPHLWIMGMVSAVVFATCVVLLVRDGR
ncbi:hypothetical protein HYPSUDRAFT_34218 [Hypholoma sublateritium FD-334 SS-4]|uniref:DUF202 domain-containing protein n=1 Tax=Hypholoma sublateritium (strain FD-334 SS-4) TaxID=945553 RepID=A0A0D2LJS2_HYPSF|nr:hypothetical protein HYPSUDRAFT_34218 [Hypholoma sublateritium FD-334 SS-4]